MELGDVTNHNIKQLKRLNQVVFPVTYNDKFYKDVLEVGELAKLGKKVICIIILVINPLTAKLFNWNFYPLEVVSR